MRTDSRCTRTSLRRGIGTRPEDRPLPRGVHAVRTVGSAQLVVGFVRGERRRRGVARRSSRRGRPIGENSDYQTSTPSLRLIRARRILTKRCRGAGVVPRTPRRGAAMAARVSLRARRHRMLGFGGGGIDGGVSADCVLRKRCCSAGSCCSRRAPGSWSGFVRRRPRRRRRAWLGLSSEAERAVFQSGALRGTTGLRRAARACSLAQVCRGTPNQSARCPSRLYQDKTVLAPLFTRYTYQYLPWVP